MLKGKEHCTEDEKNWVLVPAFLFTTSVLTDKLLNLLEPQFT